MPLSTIVLVLYMAIEPKPARAVWSRVVGSATTSWVQAKGTHTWSWLRARCNLPLNSTFEQALKRTVQEKLGAVTTSEPLSCSGSPWTVGEGLGVVEVRLHTPHQNGRRS